MKSFYSDDAEKQCWAINGRFLAQRSTGVQRYAQEIVTALDSILSTDPEYAKRLKMRLVVPPVIERRLDLSQIKVCRTRIGSGHLWDQFTLPLHAGSGILNLGNFAPVLARSQIVCIHDANTFIEPASYTSLFGLAYRTGLPLIGWRAKRVATVSQFSADMLVKYGVCRRDKIFVAPNGHEHALRWDAARAQIPDLNGLRRQYILLLGSAAKHKNVDIVLQQAQGLDVAGIDIVVVGGTSNIFSTKESTLSTSNIHHTGYVGDDELAALYEGALCLVFPSKTEGFGIPPLEAMARGCPVISSNAASLMEVGGDAVAYVDPDDGEGWREAIIGLARNSDLRATMAARGRKRTALFSWRRSAQTYLDEILRLGS
jgi:glycosyltransferase involved in cell wall biosynthesis